MKIHNQQGIVALMTVLIIGAIILVISLGMTFRSVQESDTSLDEELSYKAFVMATSCMEQALLSLSDDSTYVGNQTLVIGAYSCTIATITGNENSRVIQTSSTVNGYTRRLSVNVSNVNPPLQVSSWQEVSGF